MMDENLYETDPKNQIPVSNIELEEYVRARQKVRKSYLQNNKEVTEDE